VRADGEAGLAVCLAQPRERAGRYRGNVRGNVRGSLGLHLPLLGLEALAHRLERRDHQRSLLGRQPRLQDQRAVLVVPPAHRALEVLVLDLLGLLDAQHPPVGAHHALHVCRGAVAGNRQQVVLVLRRRHAGHCPHLGVAQLAARERLAHAWQRLERAGDAHLLPGGIEADAAAPVEPVGAGDDAPAGPALAAVELGDEHQQAVGRGVDVGGEGGDLALELLDLAVAVLALEDDAIEVALVRHGPAPEELYI
jgi:hypothetical protein